MSDPQESAADTRLDGETARSQQNGPAGVGAAAETLHQIGNVDRWDFDEISGWVWDPSDPDAAIDVELVEDGVPLLRVRADMFRPDLAAAGYGGGRHGFLIRSLNPLLPHSRHLVRLRRATDGLDLPWSPKWMVRTPPSLDERAAQFMTEVFSRAADAATDPDDLSAEIGFLLRLLNQAINAQDNLARQRGRNPEDARFLVLARAEISGRTADLVQVLLATYPMLHFAPETAAAAPDVSVIIPVHNQFSHTYNCLRSILEHPSARSLEIIVVDDCSTDETLLSSLILSGSIRVIRNDTNQGFIRSCNAGAAQARGRYLFFLNNDTLVKEGWLDALADTFEQVPNIGIAGSKLLFEDGRLQEAGGIVWRMGDGWNWGRGQDAADPRFMYLRDADWVSGAALMIERTLFEELHGFDELYVPAYYEDTDLAFRVRSLGKRVVVQPASEVIHLEGMSNGTDTAGTGIKRHQVANHQKFYRRWKDTLLSHRFNGLSPELEAEREVRRRAYFIDDTVPTPDQDAGSNAAIEHMRALQALGYKVTFLPADNMAKIDPYTTALQKIGIECLYYPYYWSVEEVFRKATMPPDLVYIHRYSNASKYTHLARRYFPNCRIVYNVADLHFLRMERQAAVDPASTSASEIATQRDGEIAAMRSVDGVIVHSTAEARLLREAAPGLNTTVVPWAVRPRPAPLPFAERSGVVFVGGFAHPPNVDAVRHYVADILPGLRKRLPDATTYIVGSKMPDEIASLQLPGLVPMGFVPVLADALHRARCTVVPLRYGAGIKGKVLESFAHGLPCVMSEVAAEGLDLPEDLAWLVAASPEDFVRKLALVHEDEALNHRLAEAGLAYIAARYSATAVTEALRQALRP